MTSYFDYLMIHEGLEGLFNCPIMCFYEHLFDKLIFVFTNLVHSSEVRVGVGNGIQP